MTVQAAMMARQTSANVKLMGMLLLVGEAEVVIEGHPKNLAAIFSKAMKRVTETVM